MDDYNKIQDAALTLAAIMVIVILMILGALAGAAISASFPEIGKRFILPLREAFTTH